MLTSIRNRNFSLLLVAFFIGPLLGRAQALPVGTPLLEENRRREQIKEATDSNVSFTIRPLYNGYVEAGDSNFQVTSAFAAKNSFGQFRFAKGKGAIKLLPLLVKQQYNLYSPYGWNDGSMIPAKGYQSQFSAGIYLKFGPVTIQLQPEYVYAQNAPYPTFPSQHSDSIWRSYYDIILNQIDAPENFGNRHYAKLFAGQSSIRFNFRKFSLGVSTENLWWGPGIRNSLVMSNNAPGFPHLTLNTTAPVQTPVGSFEGQIISGLLKKSGFLPGDTSRTFNGGRLFNPKPAGDRYINAMAFTWQPKWTRGLFVGFSRAFYLYRSDVQSSMDGYLPAIRQLFKGNVANAVYEDSLRRDQMISLFFRLYLPKARTELYAEFGRNDFAGNMRDLLLEPEHSRAFIIGFRKIVTQVKGDDIEVMAELTNLQFPTTVLVRELGSWYAHTQVQDGYTNRGQVIGAGIGPGGNSQSFGISRLRGKKRTGILLERIVHNNDFYYNAFVPSRDYWSHWVDLSVNLNRSWQHKHFLYDARLSLIKSFNYQWQQYNDVGNLHAALSVSYIFK